MHSVSYVIRTCINRRAVNHGIITSLMSQGVKKIEICNDYFVGEPVRAISSFFSNVLSRDPDTEYFVTIEDDIEVSDKLHESIKIILSRSKMSKGIIGAIKLTSDGSEEFLSPHTEYSPSLDMFKRNAEIHYTGILIISRKLAESFVKKYPETNNYGKEFDLKISRVCIENGYEYFMRIPSLGRTRESSSSSLNNTHHPRDEFFIDSNIMLNDKISFIKMVKTNQGLIY